MERQVFIAIKRTIRKFRHSDNISARAMRELEIVLRNIEGNEKRTYPRPRKIGS